MIGRKILIFGLPGAGKTTLADLLGTKLGAVRFNGDDCRQHAMRHLGFSHQDRISQAYAIGWMCDQVVRAGQIAVADLICPTQATRDAFSAGGQALRIWVDDKGHGLYEDTTAMFELSPDVDWRVTRTQPPEWWATKIADQLTSDFYPQAPTAFFIGRFQPFHAGHKALIEEGLCRVGQACIAIRNTHGLDRDNPLSFGQVRQRIENAMCDDRHRLRIISVPNIAKVYYGRNVGYGIERIDLDAATEAISATKLREVLTTG